MSAHRDVPNEDLDRDQRLMERIRDGDEGALASLYEIHAPALMRFLFALSRDEALSEDLVQETFLRAWRAAPRWRPTGKVRTWLYQIAKRRWWSRRASRAVRREREAAAARLRATARGPFSAGDALEGAEDVTRLETALLGLSPRLRPVFVLVRLEGLAPREAAEVLRLRPGTVKSRLFAAEQKLRSWLDDTPDTP